MKLSLACLATFLLPGTLAQLNMSQTQNAIGMITTETFQIETALNTLSTNATLSEVLDMAQGLVMNLTTTMDLLQGVTKEIIVSPVPEWQDLIVLAYLAFVEVNTDFFTALSSKHSIFAQFRVTWPIEAVLCKLWPRMDALADALKIMLPRDANSVSYFEEQLNTVVNGTIATYQEWCVPSRRYPGVMPKCATV
ncbi:hypothetical protein FB45DRAFT_901513, partial [Roridomyces roridus]